jgi:hypothetical protein
LVLFNLAANPKLVEEAGQISRVRRLLSLSAPENRVRTQGSQRALIDGDYSFANALRNFENLEAFAAPNSIIAIHDVVSMTWMPERQRRRPRRRSKSATLATDLFYGIGVSRCPLWVKGRHWGRCD